MLFTSNIPFSNNEIRESYTAFSLVKLGKDTNGVKLPLFFKADGDYLSTVGVYSKVPSISIFGLTTLGVRFFGLIAGIVCIMSLYLFLQVFTKNEKYSFWGTIFFTFSPLLIQTAFLNPTPLIYLSVLLLLTRQGLILKDKKKKNFIKITIVSLGVILAAVIVFEPGYVKFITKETMIESLLPSSYSYEIDKRLSFDQIYGSPLYTEKINFNRIVLNKIYYFTNAFLKSLISPFNFEKVFSPMQSQTLLAKDGFNSKSLPSMYFWELPLIILGYFILSKKQKNLSLFVAAAFGVEIFFKGTLVFVLPFIVLCEAALFVHFLEKYKKYKILLYSFVIVALITSNLIFLGIMKNHYADWVSSIDLNQNRIWGSIAKKDIEENRIFVTDRFGEPVFYYLFYEKVDPGYFLANHKDGSLLNGRIQRIDSVGDVTFKSFEFNNLNHKSNELWVGLGGEFVGQNNDYKNITGIENGEIIKKITEVDNESSRFFGRELWFVKTKIKETL